MKALRKPLNERQAARRRILILVSAGLFTILSAVVLMNNETPRRAATTRESKIDEAPINREINRLSSSAPGTAAATPSSPPYGAVTVTSADISTLTIRNLLIPVAGVAPAQLHDSFLDSRSEGRTHKALDIMAPRDTPVLATDDGKVLRLHQSDRGGIMLYQSDASGSYVYYYGHLIRYADGITEGKAVRRGEVIAFVGDTGNAGPGNYHLHFGISKMTEVGKWSGGEPINPYPLLIENSGTPSITAGK